MNKIHNFIEEKVGRDVLRQGRVDKVVQTEMKTQSIDNATSKEPPSRKRKRSAAK